MAKKKPEPKKPAKGSAEKPTRRPGGPIVMNKPTAYFAKPLEAAAEAMSEEDEALRQSQLLQAYQDRAAVLIRLDGYRPDVDRFKAERDRIRLRMQLIDELFQKAESEYRRYEVRDVQKFLVGVQGECQTRLAEIATLKRREAKDHADDVKSLNAINKRIKDLHANGPDMQQNFLDDEDEAPVDGKTASAGK